MTAGITRTFLLMAIFQAVHSFEEYKTELWDHLALARFFSTLVSDNPQLGFAIINCTIVALIFLTYLFFVRRQMAGARGFVWFWSVLELINGIGHITFGITSGGYFSGLYTAPFLILLSSVLIWQLSASQSQ